jgi:uncharacterized membrane protein
VGSVFLVIVGSGSGDGLRYLMSTSILKCVLILAFFGALTGRDKAVRAVTTAAS